ncbi:MAG TPA: D-aminoacyl-tRNA deacylase [Candidatus Angelobacter sp.]|nr:D-aminoacyl-tRNA deacylase [Candidatus Angelobacter sp.]
MRAVVQRASGARVVVGPDVVASFHGPGLVVLVGVTHDDTLERARRLATKVHELRVFEPHHATHPVAADRRELSAAELGLPLIVVSQFTLYGDTRKGRRPTWTAAAPRPVAEPLVDAVVAALRERGAEVGTGVFGADMRVELTNDGPITLVIDVDD